MKGITKKISNYIYIVISCLLALQEIHADITTTNLRITVDASVSIMSIEPIDLNFVVICKETKRNLKKRCKVLKEYIFDSDSMNQYNSNLIRELEATKKIVVTDDEYRIVHSNLTLSAYNNYYRHLLPAYGGIITMKPFRQIAVLQLKVTDTSKSYGPSTKFYFRINLKHYNLLKLKEKNGENEDLINWFRDNYVFNVRFNLFHSRDVQCGRDISEAAGEWRNKRANMNITIGDRVDNLGYFNDSSCEVESDVALHEISITYNYDQSSALNFNIICTINGICYINLAENEDFIPQLAFGKNNNFKICITENIIRFITCDKFNLLVLHRPPDSDDLFN